MVGYCFLHSTSRYEGPYPPLVEDQQCIGWNQLLFGRWSTLWTTHQTSYIQRRNIHVTSTNQGDGWSSQVIALIWKHCYQAWIDRNHALHGHTRQTKNLARCHRAQYRLRALYDLKHQCSQFVCNFWFYPSLDEHLSREPDPTKLENWLAANEARIHRHVAHRHAHHSSGQQHITDFFSSTT
jgi:hypothetical protein